MNMVQEIGHMIAPYALPAIAVVLGYFAKKAAKVVAPIVGKKNIDRVEKEIQQKQGLAYDAVRFAEDAFAKYHGETKLKHAIGWFTQQADHYGLNVTEQQAEGLVRSAYADFAKEVKKASDKPAVSEQKPVVKKEATKTASKAKTKDAGSVSKTKK